MASNWTRSTNEEYVISTAADTPTLATRIDVPSWYRFVAIWITMVCIMVIPGNLLTIVAYFRFKTLHTGTNMLICNQSIMDFLTGLGSPVHVYLNFTSTGLKFVKDRKYACLLMLWILSFAFVSSVVNIMAISLERLVAVCFPFANITPNKKQIVLLGIVAGWSFIILSLSLPTMGWNQWSSSSQCIAYSVYNPTYMTYFILGPLFVSFGITFIINLIILLSVWRRHTKVFNESLPVKLNQQTSGNPTSNSTNSSSTAPSHTNNSLPMVKTKFNQKITLMLMMVVGVFYLCWMLYGVCTVIFLVSPFHFRHTEMIIVHEFSKGLMTLNGFFNPFIYATRNKAFRTAFKKLLKISNLDE